MKTQENQRPVPGLSSKLGANAPLRCASVLAAAISACYVPTVTAQGGGMMLEEIVVTVRRRVEMEQDVPISMKAMDADFLREQNITEFNDLGTAVPAVRFSNAGTSPNDPIITIRGQRPSTAGLELDQAAPMYFNEVVMTPSGGTNLALYDLQSVQVLKGPQGTLFGRNSTGGAILVTPTRPGLDLGGYVEVEVGDYNLYGIEGAVDLPVNDAVQFRVSGKIRQRDGYQENVAENSLKGEEFWDEDSKAIRVSMNLSLGELTNLATLAYDENDMLGRIIVPQAFNYNSAFGDRINDSFNDGVNAGALDAALARAANRDVTDIETDALVEETVENTFFSNITEYELTDSLSLKNVLGYRDVKYRNPNDADGTALPIFGATPDSFGLNVNTYDVTRNPPATGYDAEQYSEEFQLIGDAFDGDLEWIAGAYWYLMEGTQLNETNAIVGPFAGGTGLALFEGGLIAESPAGDVKNEALGIFGEGTYTFNDAWSLTVGLRYSYDEREVTVKNRFGTFTPTGLVMGCGVEAEGGGTLPDNACARTVSEEFEAPTWRTSLNYTALDGMLLYGSISTGYRAGGVNLRGVNDETLEPFDEETVTTFEIGHKTDWALVNDLPLRTNFAVFYQEYEDIQKTRSANNVINVGGNTVVTFGTGAINAAEATIQGVEFDFTWLVTENLQVSMAYSYIDASYDEWDTSVPTLTGDVVVDASGSDFSYVPEQSATAGINYTIPVDPSLGEMSFNLNVYWQDEMTTNQTSSAGDVITAGWDQVNIDAYYDAQTADSYDIWNFRYDWRNVMESDFDFALYAKNLTDEEYVIGGLNVLESLGYAASTYGPPRTIGASLRYSF